MAKKEQSPRLKVTDEITKFMQLIKEEELSEDDKLTIELCNLDIFRNHKIILHTLKEAVENRKTVPPFTLDELREANKIQKQIDKKNENR